MNPNEALIQHFYTSFQHKDVSAMQNCYADEAVFQDPAFGKLNAKKVRKMWEMLLGSSKDLRIEFSAIKADETIGSAEWIAYYTYSATGGKVVNRVKASFVFKNGKIILHQDEFNFYSWAKQALGWKGKLLGWTDFFKKKVRTQANNKLQAYLEKH